MKLRLLFTFLTTMLLSGSLWAKFVNEEAARNVAKNFYYERILISDAVTYSSLQLDLATTAEKSGVAEYYVYNVRNRGYIVVSADDATIPILAYSFSSQYEPEKMPAAFRYWTNVFSLQIAEVRRVDAQPTQEITQQWKYFSNTSNIVNNPNRGLRAVDPLIESSWGQGNFYNDLCPVDAGSSPYTGNDHVPVGCVATSTSQVMHYWKFPKVGTGSNSYYASGYGTQSANFGATTYNWHNMPNRLTTVNNDVATLCYHIGVGVDMSYDTDGSGSDTYYVRNLLKNNFYYSTNISYKSKNSTYFDSNSYSDAQWIAILVPQLDAHQPMVYSGFESGGGGHAFVCDGYQGTDYFHFNFGWDGYGDGYFYITSINSAGGNFTSGQAIVCNIYPSTSMYPYFCNATGVTYTTPEGMFDDGSGPNADYQNNANCNFLIAPPNMNQIVLTVNSVNTEDAQDIVTIFDGETTSAPVLGTFSGTTPPTGTILSTQGKMLLVFSSNGTTTDAGWQVSYSSRSCGGSVSLTAPSGTIEDGSGTSEYSNFLNCTWIIEPSNVSTITLTFVEFGTQAVVDKVRIYDDLVSSTPIAQYHGSSIPAAVTSTTGLMRINFTTNSSITGTGWKANYTSTPSSGIESVDMGIFSVYPNPANKSLNVNLAEKDCTIELFDILGNKVFAAAELSGKVVIPVSAFSEGVYLMKVHSQGNQRTARISVIH